MAKAWWFAWGLVVVSATAHAEDTAWIRQAIAPPVTVELPGEPTHEHQTQSWMLGTTETDTFFLEAFGGQLAASSTTAPATAVAIAGPDLIFTTTKSTILKQSGGAAVSWSPVERGGVKGRRLVYNVDENGKAHVGTMEVFVYEGRILTFDIRLPAGTPRGAAERFLSSLRFADGD